ncbi:MAG: TRAP transporter small permease subunit [Saprospiraceae bacterium]|nr:TRAP transporter small permease subunit [Saprospiraceae bacterium]
MQKIIDSIDQVSERIGRGTSWLTLLLVILVCFDVVTRYVLSDTAAWIMELEWHLFALIFLLGASFAFKHDRHVRVDLFYAKFSAKDKALVNLIGNSIFLIPWCIVIIIYSFNYGMTSFEIRETSPDPGGLPARYLIKFAITFGIVLLLLQAIGEALKAYQQWRSPETSKPE